MSKTVVTESSLSMVTALLVQYGPCWIGVGTGSFDPRTIQTALQIETSTAANDGAGNNTRVQATLSQTTSDDTESIFGDTFSASAVITWASSGTISEIGLFTTNGMITYVTGTIAVSGTAVTGVGTSFTTAKVLSGYRIGFGSTNPIMISTWYEIDSINSNTSLTLTTTAPTVAAGTPYIIQTGSGIPNGGVLFASGTIEPELDFDEDDTATVSLSMRYRLPGLQ